MNRRFIIYFFVLLSINLFSQSLDSPAATVELIRREIITKKNLDSRYTQLKAAFKQQGMSENSVDKKEVLDSMIQEIILLQGAEKDKVIVTDAQIDNKIKSILQQYSQAAKQNLTQADLEKMFGLSINDIKAQLKKTELLQAYLLKKDPNLFAKTTPPTDNEIAVKFNQMKNAGAINKPAFIQVAHIFFNTQGLNDANKSVALKTLSDVRRKINSKELTFEDAAKIYSEDKDSKYNGGDIGWAPYGDQKLMALYNQKIVDSLFAMKIGSISDVLESKVGYHIIKVKGKQEASIARLDDKIAPNIPTTYRERLKEAIIAEKQKEKQDILLKKIYDSLSKDAEIKIYIEDLK